MSQNLFYLLSLLAGFAILIQPRLLNYIIAFYLIITGALGLMSAAGIHF
ncbi:DUF3096 domain-containing protein [Candidatus Venteria ishoeyi]|uniref:DUF3096 domain-containing protein n=1 Tax=Candidatus Venteria ishoeyi TaxID=1899563 RepID=A0A1H6FBF4_9GAMM|nr:DUF3096 domain-containing protein [Candidatus Venteria ishoeyi]MDM8546261.1 DUF3096 domain-containing protein [Candidatus Venteria ishoeyi]SEH07422.1 Uncharacterised protein [Candidatus Venteria ishoeyi]